MKHAYRFFRNHAGYVVGENARVALALARAEAEIQTEIESSEFRYRWVQDECPDLSWYDGDPSDLEVEGCILERKCPGCGAWEQLESLWGICNADNDYRRVIEAELALEVA